MSKYLCLILVLMVACDFNQSSQGENFLANVEQLDIKDDSQYLVFFKRKRKPIKPAFEILPTGSTKPAGWIADMMRNDLDRGIVGALDQLYPGIQSDDIYAKNRRGGMNDIPDMGDLVLTGAAWEKSIMWWNAETIGNWWDGYVRHAFLTDDREAIEKSKLIVNNLLSSQGTDGYIGIYKKNLRYQHTGSNGELWAQTTAFRMLLAYYEFTQEQRVLDAVTKAVSLTIKHYGPNATNPFRLKNAFGGVTHGLMMTDVCEHLFRLTDDQKYQDFAVYLYEAFSTYSINRSFNDLRYTYLIEQDSLFTGHAVHTYEHFRTLVNAYYQTGYEELNTALNNALFKLDRCILPSGAGHGNEWIAGMDANPTTTATEFCSMLELRNSLGSLLQKTGQASFGDHAEKLTFNAIMGFRNKDGTAIAYGKHDNAYIMDGQHHESHGTRLDPRYKYSPTHSDPAVCCVPNYGRNMTYYLDHMWMKKGEGIAAVLYGPGTTQLTIEGVVVNIDQATNYPFEDQIVVKVETEKETSFPIFFRKPEWVSDMQVNCPNATISYNEGYFKVDAVWSDNEINLSFVNEVKMTDFNGEKYFQRGPLVFALSIPHQERFIKDYGLEEFQDVYYFPNQGDHTPLTLGQNEFNYFNQLSSTYPWFSGDTYLEGNLYDNKGNQSIQVKLVPMGSTILRQVTFPIN